MATEKMLMSPAAVSRATKAVTSTETQTRQQGAEGLRADQDKRGMGVLTAIHQRHAVRSYQKRPIALATITELLELAARAPSAMNKQPWAFVVTRDQELMKMISTHAKELWLAADHPEISGMSDLLRSPTYNIFYDAPVLVVICATSCERQAARDCYLAGENLMLAATAMGIASCPIGFAWPALGADDIKARLNIPAEYDPVLPIVLGYGQDAPHSTERRMPEMLYCDLE